jgi:hypothetical protein
MWYWISTRLFRLLWIDAAVWEGLYAASCAAQHVNFTRGRMLRQSRQLYSCCPHSFASIVLYCRLAKYEKRVSSFGTGHGELLGWQSSFVSGLNVLGKGKWSIVNQRVLGLKFRVIYSSYRLSR